MKYPFLLFVIFLLTACSVQPHMSFDYHQKGSPSGGSGSGSANIFLSHPF